MPGLALRVGRVLVRLVGSLAGWLVLVLTALGALGLLSFETVDEATCAYDPQTDGCQGPEWLGMAVLVAAIGCLALAVLLLPQWLVHLAERARHRRGEMLQTPRLHALDGWLMAGQVSAPGHRQLKARLQDLIARSHGSQVARHASGAFAAFSLTMLLAGVAGGLVAGAVELGVLAATAWLVAIVAAVCFVAALAANVAARRAERQAWAEFERDWDAALHAGVANAANGAAARGTRKAPGAVA